MTFEPVVGMAFAALGLIIGLAVLINWRLGSVLERLQGVETKLKEVENEVLESVHSSRVPWAETMRRLSMDVHENRHILAQVLEHVRDQHARSTTDRERASVSTGLTRQVSAMPRREASPAERAQHFRELFDTQEQPHSPLLDVARAQGPPARPTSWERLGTNGEDGV